MGKDFGQYCGLARALDVVGDRWNLLIVRQLLVAPARYRELREGLPGVATNLLVDRLRDLEAKGVVERRLADGGVVTYALTPWGAHLREPIDGLIRWSTPLMVRGPGDDAFRIEWLLVALPALFADKPPAAAGSPTIGVEVGGEVIQLRITPAGVEVSRPDGRKYDAVIKTDAALTLGLAAGVLGLDDVADAVQIDGDRGAVRAIFGR